MQDKYAIVSHLTGDIKSNRTIHYINMTREEADKRILSMLNIVYAMNFNTWKEAMDAGKAEMDTDPRSVEKREHEFRSAGRTYTVVRMKDIMDIDGALTLIEMQI